MSLSAKSLLKFGPRYLYQGVSPKKDFEHSFGISAALGAEDPLLDELEEPLLEGLEEPELVGVLAKALFVTKRDTDKNTPTIKNPNLNAFIIIY
jgi:hypothetical protein